jgi:hypothetical protein
MTRVGRFLKYKKTERKKSSGLCEGLAFCVRSVLEKRRSDLMNMGIIFFIPSKGEKGGRGWVSVLRGEAKECF